MSIIDNEQHIENSLIKSSFSQKIKFYGYGLKFSLKKKQSRTNLVINQEYDKNAYQDLYQKQIWTEKNLENLCYMRFINNNLENNDLKATALFNEKLFSTKLLNLKKLYGIKLVNEIKKIISKNDTLCELGCGFGKYLFLLRVNNISCNLEGYDISYNGVELAKKIDSQFKTGISFKQFDITKDLSKIDLSNKIIFTHLALEQLKPELKNIINNLIESKPKEVIHFEHSPNLYSSGIRHFVSKIYYDKKDYQTQLLQILSKYNDEGKINLLNTEKFPHGLNPLHEMGVIRWTVN
mgnify:FL=1